mgnify:CR=1 FL=1|tara:strand:+ start:326 stop:499 length:174 start_codon:yes stop_codon:yes gene_type:complete
MEKIQKLLELITLLQDFEEKIEPGMKYAHARDIRKLCQEIKSISQDLRLEVNTLRKQ